MAAIPLNTSIPSDLDAELRAAAARTGIPLARLVQQGVRLRLAELETDSGYRPELASEVSALGTVTPANLDAARALLQRIPERRHPISHARLRGQIANVEGGSPAGHLSPLPVPATGRRHVDATPRAPRRDTDDEIGEVR